LAKRTTMRISAAAEMRGIHRRRSEASAGAGIMYLESAYPIVEPSGPVVFEHLERPTPGSGTGRQRLNSGLFYRRMGYVGVMQSRRASVLFWLLALDRGLSGTLCERA
jgi:hypothetical protein